jgi:hypothetical protein
MAVDFWKTCQGSKIFAKRDEHKRANSKQQTAHFPYFVAQRHPDPASAQDSENVRADDEPNLIKTSMVVLLQTVILDGLSVFSRKLHPCHVSSSLATGSMRRQTDSANVLAHFLKLSQSHYPRHPQRRYHHLVTAPSSQAPSASA